MNLTASGVIDGCGADASWQKGEGWGLDAATAEAWRTGHLVTQNPHRKPQECTGFAGFLPLRRERDFRDSLSRGA